MRKTNVQWVVVLGLVAVITLLAVLSTANSDSARSYVASSGNVQGQARTILASNDDTDGRSRVGMPGGLAGERPVDDAIRTLVTPLHGDVVSRAGLQGNGTPQVTPLTYKSQVVAGINYFIKFRVSFAGAPAASYVVARIFRPLPGQGAPAVVAVRSVGENDPISYFA